MEIPHNPNRRSFIRMGGKLSGLALLSLILGCEDPKQKSIREIRRKSRDILNKYGTEEIGDVFIIREYKDENLEITEERFSNQNAGKIMREWGALDTLFYVKYEGRIVLSEGDGIVMEYSPNEKCKRQIDRTY